MTIAIAAKKIIKATGLTGAAIAAANAYAGMLPRKQVCTRGGITYELDLSEVIDRAIYLGGWEPGTISFLRTTVRSGDVVVEVGANVGAHTLILADLVGPSGCVHAFEPTAYAMGKLQASLARNPRLAGRVQLHSELVTNHELATPNLAIRSSFPVGERERDDEVVSARAVALDSMELPRLDLMKIDVDGYDFKVLQGATEIIQRHKPVLFVELCEYTLNAQRDSIRDIFSLLQGLGYAATHENGNSIAGPDEVLRMVGDNTSINGVFRRRL